MRVRRIPVAEPSGAHPAVGCLASIRAQKFAKRNAPDFVGELVDTKRRVGENFSMLAQKPNWRSVHPIGGRVESSCRSDCGASRILSRWSLGCRAAITLGYTYIYM